MAAIGNGQSPIDITDWTVSSAPAPSFAYQSNASRIERVQGWPMIHFAPGSELALGDNRFQLLQLHWHTPAEHTVTGEEFAAEVHYVHANANEELLVIAALYRLGHANAELTRIIAETPQAGEEADVVPSISAVDHQPDSDGYYHYVGSLTAPPFSEPVQWYVGRTVHTVSQRQVEQLQALNGGPNARPLQDRNSRDILCLGC